MTGDHATSDSSARGPICPNCREPLRGNLRQEQVIPQGGHAVAVTYCGACGWTLDCAPARTGSPPGRALMRAEEVAAPADEQTLEGQFQLRCRELIGEIRSLGFEPFVWVAMINDLGAAPAARQLLADHQRLAVTPWLVRRGGRSSRWSTRSVSRDGPGCSPRLNAPRRRCGSRRLTGHRTADEPRKTSSLDPAHNQERRSISASEAAPSSASLLLAAERRFVLVGGRTGCLVVDE